MSYVRRAINVTITLGTGQFGDTLGNTVTLTGLRVLASIAAAGGDAQGQLQLRIYGLPISMINQLTTIGPIATQIRSKNTVLVAAGDVGSALTTVFEGTIDTAYGDFQGAPDVALNINALSALAAAVKPVGANSWKGSVDVAVIMETLADTMGFVFENNGVTAQLSNPYFPGTALAQVKACAKAANIRYSTDLGTLAIWPKNGFREGDIPIISKETGMVGYPLFSSNGMSVHSIFIPNIKGGSKVTVQSTLSVANGTWIVGNVVHNLESERPGGAWFTQLACYPNVE